MSAATSTKASNILINRLREESRKVRREKLEEKMKEKGQQNNKKREWARIISPKKRRGKNKFTTPTKVSNTLTPWLNKRNKTPPSTPTKTSDQNNVRQSPGTKEKLLLISPEMVKIKRNKRSGGKPLFRTSSEEKYGVGLPTIEDFNANKRKLEKNLAILKDIDDNIKFVIRPGPSSKIRSPDRKKKKVKCALDCKHLSFEEIEEGFRKYHSHLDDIENSRVKFDRKDKFKKSQLRNDEDLICNSYCYVYTQEQKSHMLDLLDKAFNTANQSMGKYFLQVLVPELCLLLFMDEYEMDREQAIEYLDHIPIEIP